ncbi:MAG: DUF1772 domain-containing protein [Bacteroidetes bacterium]|nr:MAG: DUF1772 domain-containing protein [Bacteroidota bacterium]
MDPLNFRDKVAERITRAQNLDVVCKSFALPMKLKVVEFSALILAALVMGVFWGTWFTLTRSIHDFSAAEFIHIGKTIIANVAVPMSIIMPATLLLMLIAMWLSRRENRPSFYLYSISFLLMIVTLVITVGVEVPIDNKIKSWTEATIPANWESLRHTWDELHPCFLRCTGKTVGG